MDSNFFKIYRRKGCGITLEILDSFKNKEALETQFLKELPKHNSYFNDFYWSKKELLKIGLIGYKLDKEANKIIFLTKKGKSILNLLEECEFVLEKNM